MKPTTMRTACGRLVYQSSGAWKSFLKSKRSPITVRYLGFSFAGPRNLDEIVKKDVLKFKSRPEVAAVRYLSFSFAGPRSLDEIVKKDILKSLSGAEVSDIWYTYHESKDNVLGLVLSGKDAKTVLARAAQCPFFVQPVFRDDGFFMMMTQFQQPSHFLMAYLEDYRMDPSGAQPLMTFSVFDDFSEDKDLTLIRCDILNPGIDQQEGLKVVQNLLDGYKNEDEYVVVHTFNKAPQSFNIDEFIEKQNEKWRKQPPSVNV